MHLKHHQKDAIVRSIHDQPNITAKELLSNYVDTPDSIDFTRRKSVARIISRERTTVLSTKLEGVVVSDSISSLRELCDRLWFKDALDRHNSDEGCLDLFKTYVIGRQFMESDNAVFITFATPWDLLNVFRAIASGWSLQIHADVTSKASTSALNKLNFGVNQLGGHYAPWSSSLIPAESESSATYMEAYKAASAASRKFIDVRLCEDANCATCNAIGTLLENRDVKDVLESEAYHKGRKFPVLQSMGDNSEAFQKFVRDHLGMDANICQTHATAIGKNNGTQARHFKNRDVHDQFYELILRIKECTFVEPGFRMQEQLVEWLVSKEEPDAAEWFKRYWSGPRKGRWMLGNGGIGTIANQQGIESTFKWEREDISHGKQVNLDLSAVCVILI